MGGERPGYGSPGLQYLANEDRLLTNQNIYELLKS